MIEEELICYRRDWQCSAWGASARNFSPLGRHFHEGGQVFERIDSRQLRGVDDAHEDIPDVCTPQGLLEGRVFAIMRSLA